MARSAASSLLELRRHLLEGTNLLGLDLEHLDERGAEAALDRRADLALLEREGGVRHRAVDHGGLGQRAEIDVLVGEAAFLGDLGEARALGDAIGGGARFLRVGKDDLLDVAPFRRDVAAAALLVGALRIRVGDLDPVRLLGRDAAPRSTSLRYSGARNRILRSS